MAKSSGSAKTSGSSPTTSKTVVIGGKIRAVRVPDDLWEAAHKAAESNGETVSEVIRRALEAYVAQTKAESEKDPE